MQIQQQEQNRADRVEDGREDDMDLYSVGEMVIDFIPGTEEGVYSRNAGGAPANVAIAASRNGLDAGMCCRVGDDDFGRFLMHTLWEEGVCVLCTDLCEEAITTMAFVTLDEKGERSFTFVRKPGADMMLRPQDIREEDIRSSVIVHAGSCSLSARPAADATVKALRLGREMGKIVSFDVNYRNLQWNDDAALCAEAVKGILPYVDLLKISEEEADMLGGEAALPGLMRDSSLTAVIETLGPAGARVFYQDRMFAVPGRKANAVDATGAGDAFWGGFLSSLILQDVMLPSQITEAVLKKAMLYGNVSGALCVEKKGAITSLPTREEVEAILAGDGRPEPAQILCTDTEIDHGQHNLE